MEIFDIILMAAFAGFIFLRLRAELGKKSGGEPTPPPRQPERAEQTADIVDISGKPIEAPIADVVDIAPDSIVRAGLLDIRNADRRFDASGFLTGAQTAHSMILEAFWTADEDLLKDLLSDDVFDQFSRAIKHRDEAEQTLDNRILDELRGEIVAASLKGKTAEISVLFETEIMAVTRDKDGNILEGNPSDSITIKDRWTFNRLVSSSDPTWTLVATRSG